MKPTGAGGGTVAERPIGDRPKAKGRGEATGTSRARKRHRKRRRPSPGSRPGSLVLPEDAPPLQITVISYDAEHLEERTLRSVEELPDLLQANRVVWIDVVGLGDEASLARMRDVLGIHPLAMADVVNVPQRPKVDHYDGRHLVIAHAVECDLEGHVEPEQVSFMLGPGWVVSFREKPGEIFTPTRDRIRSGAGIRSMGTDFLLYALLDAVIDDYFPVVEALGEQLDALEEAVTDRPERMTLARIHEVRRMLIHLHRIQWRQRDAINELLRDEDVPISRPVRIYLRDTHDHAIQVLDFIETQREIAVGLMDIYLSTVSNRMNDIMKTLTVVSTVFIPLTFIVGVYGMNFEDMPELGYWWAYPVVWLVMLVIAAALLLWFQHLGWLELPSHRAKHDA